MANQTIRSIYENSMREADSDNIAAYEGYNHPLFTKKGRAIAARNAAYEGYDHPRVESERLGEGSFARNKKLADAIYENSMLEADSRPARIHDRINNPQITDSPPNLDRIQPGILQLLKLLLNAGMGQPR